MMSAKPTLLVTASTFPRWESDSEPRFVYDLCVRLAETFHVVVLAPHAPGAASYEQWGQLHIHRYRYAPAALETLAYEGGITANLKQHRWKWLLLPGFFFGQWLALRQLLKTYPVVVIHAHWLIPQGLMAVAATYGKIHKPRLLCTSHGGDLFGLQDKVSLQLKRWVIKHCDALTVVSHFMVGKVQALAGDTTPPISVIPMGTDLEHTFVPDPTVHRLPNQLLFVGRLVEKKGVKYLLQALQEVSTQRPDTTLVIAGSGPLQAELESMTQALGLAQQVTFAGRLEHKALVRLYQESTVAVFPFVQAKDGDMEGLGLVMVEAMGCGCPVIASDLPAVRDVVNHRENLCEPANPTELAICIQRTLENSSETQGIYWQAQHQAVCKSFGWDNINSQYQTLIEKIIDSPAFQEALPNA